MLSETSYGIAKRLEFIANEIERRHPATILDYGCGNGALLTSPLAARFPHVSILAVDSDARSIAAARAGPHPPNVRFATPEALGPGERFDLIVASEVLEHVASPSELLSELSSHVASAGCLILTVPNGYGPYELFSFLEDGLYLAGIYDALRWIKRRIRSSDKAPLKAAARRQADTLAVSPHLSYFTLAELLRHCSAAGLQAVCARPRTFLCGFGIDYLVHGEALSRLNARVADALPMWLASDWMLVLEPARRGATSVEPKPGGGTRLVLSRLSRARATVKSARAYYPPTTIWRTAARVAWRRVRTARSRRLDQRRTTYCSSSGGQNLRTFLADATFDLSLTERRRAALLAITEHALAHRFDVLGSGWVNVRHGMTCRGLEGFRYGPHPQPKADREGRWLAGHSSEANLAASRTVWQRVDPGYVPIDWHLDVKSGYRWSPRSWYLDVPYGYLPGVDVKVPWELARMHHLPQLAWAALAAKRGIPGFRPPQEYAREFRNQVLDFIATNPPRFGVNWRSGMDVAIRSVNWLVAYDLLRNAGCVFDAPFENALRDSVYCHGDHVMRNLDDHGRFRGNHYLAEVCGLVFIGAYLSPSRNWSHWFEFGMREFLAETSAQFNSDGSNFEASTSYHRLCSEMVAYTAALLLAADRERGAGNSSPFPEWFYQRLGAMRDFTAWLQKPSGDVAQIGDNDSGRFLKLDLAYDRLAVRDAIRLYANLSDYDALPPQSDYWLERALDHRTLLHLLDALSSHTPSGTTDYFLSDHLGAQVVAHLSRNAKLPPTVGAPASRVGTSFEVAEQLVRSQADYRTRSWRLDAAPDLTEGVTAAAFTDFGVYVLRSDRLFIATRCGSTGQNGRGGHAHNDQLSIELWLDGKDVLRDPGAYVYTALPARRDQYRSVLAHAAPAVDSGEPARLGPGPFRLSNTADGSCLYFGRDGFVGKHHGYGWPLYRSVRLRADSIIVTDFAPDHTYATFLSGLPELTDRRSSDTSVRVPFSPAYGVRCSDPR